MYIAVVNGERHEIATPGIASIVKFERHFNMSAEDFKAQRRVEHMAFMGYVQLQKEGKFAGSFDDFIDVLEDIEQVDEEASASDPSDEAAPPA